MRILVRAARRLLRPVRAWARTAMLPLRPLRPPLEPPERVAVLDHAHPGDEFISGNGIAARCRYVVNYDDLSVNEEVDNDWWFCKTDFLEYLFRRVAPKSPFVLFTHNSDYSIDARYAHRLGRRNLVAWFGVNVAHVHPKLFAVPLGIANPVWPHGDPAALAAVQAEGLQKDRLFDVSFRVETNPAERARCLGQTGLALDAPLPYRAYLERLAASYFCVAPRGNGIDTHRTWEALYVGTIPIVTRSVLTDQHRDLPLLVLDDWSDFGSIDFSAELYQRLWAGWRPEELRLDRYLERIRRIVASLRETGSG